jgi:hypothetical protein
LPPHEIIPGNDAPSLECRNLRSTGPGREFTTLNTGLKRESMSRIVGWRRRKANLAFGELASREM